MIIPVVETHSHRENVRVWFLDSEEKAIKKIKELLKKEKRDLETEGLKEEYDFIVNVFNDGKLASIDNYNSSIYDETETLTWTIGEVMEN